MRKFYFMLVSLVLMATMANAQVNGISDLYGKYKLTATIEVTDEGKGFAENIKNDCEVVITSDPSGNGAIAVVQGLFGTNSSQLVSEIELEKNRFYVNNPNPSNYGLWDGYVGVTDVTLDNLQLYTMYYNYNPNTKEITIDDFQIAQFSWPEPDHKMTATVYANVKNAKLTLVEAEKVEVPEIAGEWSFHPYSIGYVKDKNFVYEFKMNLVAKAGDDTNTNWEATFNFEGYDPFTLDATFDGATLNIPFDELYLDAENKIRFGISATKSTPENVFVKAGKFSFTYGNKTLMWQNEKIYIRQEGVDTVVVDSITMEVEYKDIAPIVQSVTYGWIEREDPNAYDWSGTYNVTVGDKDVRYDDETASFAKEFNVVVKKDRGSYYISEFLGYKMYDYYLSDFELAPNEDGKSASIKLTGYDYLCTWNDTTVVEGDSLALKMYYKLTDLNYSQEPIAVTLNEDGTISVGSFAVTQYAMRMDTYGAFWDEDKKVALFRGLTLSKSDDTAVEDIVVDENVVEGIFDIQGRRIDEITAPGLYIVNGKKVLVK